MGQYYYVVNLDKKQYLDPHKFGDGLKLFEFGASGNGTMLGLTILLATETPIHDHAVTRSWVGDRIVIAGDYSSASYLEPGDKFGSLYSKAMAEYEDVSYAVIRALCQAKRFRMELEERNSIDRFGKTVYQAAMEDAQK